MEAATKEREHVRQRSLDQDTVCAAFQATAEDHPERVALRTKGDEFSISWADYAERVKNVAAGLASLGLGHGDTLAVMLTNRPEFHIVDSAAMHLGATPFSIYNTYSPEQIEFLVSDAKCRIVVTEKAFLDRILEVAKKDDSPIEHVISVDGGEGAMSLDELEAKGEDDFDFEAAWKAVKPDDVLTLIYTSGTTGPPKGVMITHQNLVSAGNSFDEMIKFPDGARVVSYLPMAHIAERACTHYLPILMGWSTTCCPDAREVMGYLPEVRPNWFFSVPRIWEKAKAAIEAGIEADDDEKSKEATKWAIGVGLKKARAEQAGEEVPEELAQEYAKADKVVLSKIRERMGFDRLEALNVGAAPTPPEVIEFYHAIGLPLAELWGMSETCGAGTVNRPDRKIKIGTVGQESPRMQVKLADDGEVMVKGEMVMKGYRNQPEKTKETFTEDGWLLTGDIGEFDDEGYLKIVDRKKELIINAAGKNMSPANIEAKVKASSPLIGQAIAIGDNRPYNVALVTLDPDTAPGFAKQKGISDSSPEALAEEQAVIEEVERGIKQANEQLARVEQIKKFKVLPTDWEAGGDELTPTMKLKRKPISEKYKEEIEALYA
jgi:long-subunit acyl-CoA synthetase (AMP-forming)